MNERKPIKPEIKIHLPADADEQHTLLLNRDEYELLGDLIEFLWRQEPEDFVKFANDFHKQLYREDWRPDVDWTKEKLEKTLESLTHKQTDAGWFGRRDEN